MKITRRLMVAILSFTMVASSFASVFATDVTGADSSQTSGKSAQQESAASSDDSAVEESEQNSDAKADDKDQASVDDKSQKDDETADDDVKDDTDIKLADHKDIKLDEGEKELESKPNEAVVLMKDDYSKKATNAKLRAVDKSLEVNETIDIYGEDKTVAVVQSQSLSTEKLVDKLNKQDDVIIAEPNYIYHAMGATNDTYADKQWSYDASKIDVQRDIGYTGEKKVIAVVDTGVDYTNEDLKDVMWTNTHYPALKGSHGFDFANLDNSPIDDNGHGSHCAGIIAASRNNNAGIKGVSDVKIMALKALNADGEGELSAFIYCYNYIIKAQKLGVDIVAVNNSWGGEGDSEILTQMINTIGKNGAISVCAAGNESANNDEVEVFPAGCDSKYVLSVAATDVSGKVATYSNYGKESVDIAAPGTNIWSTVCYDSFNPGLYKSDKSVEVTDKFYDFENSNDFDGEIRTVIKSKDEVVSDNCEVSTVEGINGEGKAVKLTFKNLKEEDMALVKIPYTSGKNNKKHISSVMRTAAPGDRSGIFCMFDESRDLSENEVYNKFNDYIELGNVIAMYMFSEDETSWNHYDYSETASSGEDRYMYMAIYAGRAGDYSLVMDDLGISKDVSSDKFEKYDLYSGTSMAAPLVAGAYALKNDEVSKMDETDPEPEEVKAALMSNVNSADNLPVLTTGVLDFSKESKAPHIRGVELSGDSIKITGFGLAGSTVSVNDKVVETAESVGSSGGSIVIPNEGWTNKVVTIKVENSDGTDTKENIYLVKGKKPFKRLKQSDEETDYDDEEGDSSSAYKSLATDGKFVYAVNDDTVVKASVSSLKKATSEPSQGELWKNLVTLKKSHFTKKSADNSNAEYGVVIDNSLTYMNGRLYFVAGYGELAQAEVTIGEIDLGGDWIIEETETRTALYAGEYKLFSVDTTGKNLRAEKKLPKAVTQSDGRTLAAYNGKLFVIGGYDYSDVSGKIMSSVYSYKPATGKWNTEKNLPAPSAEGTACQTGNNLVYVGKVSEKDKPEIMVYNGKSWSSETVNALCKPAEMECDGNKYNMFALAVAPCRRGGKDGVVVSGVPTEEGDTFIYTISDKKFKDTGYQYSMKLAYSNLTGAAGGSTFLTGDISSGEISYANVSSGMIRVTTSKSGKGTVTKSTDYMPGNKASVKAKAKKGYYVKSISINGKVKKYSKKTTSKTVTVSSAITSAKKVKVTFAKK